VVSIKKAYEKKSVGPTQNTRVETHFHWQFAHVVFQTKPPLKNQISSGGFLKKHM